MKLSLSLPCEIFCLKPVFGAYSYAVSHSGSLHTYKQTQKRVHLDLVVAYEQVKENVQKSISHHKVNVTLEQRKLV